MKVEILHDGKVIGHCGSLDPIDPPMGVAAGRFVPTLDYDPRLHACLVEGERNDPAGEAPITARSAAFGEIPCAGVVIEDCAATLNEVSVTILGIPYPEYETFFGSHATYRAYWGRD
jgi:hypothetical protein